MLFPKVENGVVKQSLLAQLIGFALKALPIATIFDSTDFFTTKIPFHTLSAKCVWTVIKGAAKEFTTLSAPTTILKFSFVVFTPGAFEVKRFTIFANDHAKGGMPYKESLKKERQNQSMSIANVLNRT